MSEDLAFSRPLKVDEIPRNGGHQKLRAEASERAALAAQFGLPGIAALEADFEVKRSGKGARVRGVVRADVTQTCVVSAEPFEAHIEEEVDVRFQPPSDERKPRVEEEIVQFDADDEPDPIVDGKIDLGALAAEFVALALDPYPRKPGAEFDSPAVEDEEDSPFAALKKLEE